MESVEPRDTGTKGDEMSPAGGEKPGPASSGSGGRVTPPVAPGTGGGEPPFDVPRLEVIGLGDLEDVLGNFGLIKGARRER